MPAPTSPARGDEFALAWAARSYIDQVKAIYSRVGKAWFAEHNQSDDPSVFNVGIGSELIKDQRGDRFSFVATFGDRERYSPASTPWRQIVVIYQRDRRVQPRSELELDGLQRQHPDWSATQILLEVTKP